VLRKRATLANMGAANSASVNVRSFGAKGDGVTNDRAAIQAAFDTGRPVVFTDSAQYYIEGQVRRSADNVAVSLGDATVVFGGSESGFIFGSHADAPRYRRLQFQGGTIKNKNPAEPVNRLFISVSAYADFDISDIRMEGVSNGGVHIGSGTRDGMVERINIVSSGRSGLRGIWLNGSGTSDFQEELLDISSITRNRRALPAGGVRNVAVRNCRITAPIFGIYTHNAHYCTLENNHIDIDGSGNRCITLNTYSPRVDVRGNELIGGTDATGILVTQFSQGVTIENNVFRGTFGGGADVKVQSLAQAQVRGNRFLTSTTINITCDRGGSAVIQNNEFAAPTLVPGQRPLRVYTIDAFEAGKEQYGNTATLLPGVVFQGNTVRNRPTGVHVSQQTAANGNRPGLQFIIVRDNTFENMDRANGPEEYGLFIEGASARNSINYSYFNNRFVPPRPDRNRVRDVSGVGRDMGRTR
jgi:hypothetical protein